MRHERIEEKIRQREQCFGVVQECHLSTNGFLLALYAVAGVRAMCEAAEDFERRDESFDRQRQCRLREALQVVEARYFNFRPQSAVLLQARTIRAVGRLYFDTPELHSSSLVAFADACLLAAVLVAWQKVRVQPTHSVSSSAFEQKK